ncbi:hypothetical protein CASFOL_005973 [Castilleja foliolosa]|uniref:Uncharacterized protein n=1 Tax=Castilleja foliolosa TaxID=1961234 RepID=A0ABD3E8Y6_9LAMI
MSRAQEPHKPFLPFENPFRKISPKGSYLSPKLLSSLDAFEETLSGRIRKLMPAGKEDVLRLSWMKCAIESLCEIHTDVKTFIKALKFPVHEWEDNWVDIYLDNSVNLLDICISFTSEISRLNQGHLYLQCVPHNLNDASPKQFSRARSSLDGWKKHIGSKNLRFDRCFELMDGLAQKLDLPKIKNSVKGKILMRAMYGVRVVTLLVCRMFAAAFSGSAQKLMDLQVPETFLWARAFADLQGFVNTEIRSLYSSGRVTVLKDLETVDAGVKKLCPIVEKGLDDENLLDLTSSFGQSANNLLQGLDLLGREVDRFFHIVLMGRNALLSNLRVGGANNKVEEVWCNNIKI